MIADHEFIAQPGSNMCVCGEPDQAHYDRNDDVEVIWQRHWKEIILPDGVHVDPAMTAVKRELYDYWQLLQEVPKVYDHITGGVISRPNAPAYMVTAVADEHYAALAERYADSEGDDQEGQP